MSGYTRTRERLALAKFHLNGWLAAKRGGGSNSTLSNQAHKEALVYQVLNGYQVFLLETAGQLRVSCAVDVSAQELRELLKAQGRDLVNLSQLVSLESDPNSWLSQCRRLEGDSKLSEARSSNAASSFAGVQVLVTSNNSEVDFGQWLSQFEDLLNQFSETLVEY